MRLLLDTSTLVWQLGMAENKLGIQAMKLMRAADVVYVSAISIVEMHIKTMIGKLDTPVNFEQKILQAGNTMLSFSSSAADAIRDLPTLARHDPFDRMLLAQARADGLLFLTSDTLLLKLELDYLIDARL